VELRVSFTCRLEREHETIAEEKWWAPQYVWVLGIKEKFL